MSCLCMNNVAWAAVKRGIAYDYPSYTTSGGEDWGERRRVEILFWSKSHKQQCCKFTDIAYFYVKLLQCQSSRHQMLDYDAPQRVISSDTKNGGFGSTPPRFDQKFGPCSLPSASIPSTRCRSPRVSYASPLSQSWNSTAKNHRSYLRISYHFSIKKSIYRDRLKNSS